MTRTLAGSAGAAASASAGSSRAESAYRTLGARRMALLGVLGAVFAVSACAALCVGAAGIGPGEVLECLLGGGGLSGDIVRNLRLPRVVMGALAGTGLAVAGALTQAILRNPLASPFTLGIASGAGFGAVASIVLVGSAMNGAVAGGAFVCALGTAGAILAVARTKNARAETLILSGVAMMFLFSSLTSFLQYTATMEQLHEIVFWFFGSLSKAGWSEIGLSALLILPPLPLAMRWCWDLNLLMAGDEAARSAGVETGRLRVAGVVLAALMTAGAICFTGVIGFIGLVAPHMARMLVGGDHRFLIPASALCGGSLAVLADALGRTVWQPQVIPVGIMTSFIGVPFFFWLLMRRTREHW